MLGMKMSKNNCTRREFLKTTSLGLAAMAAPSCMSAPGKFAEIQSFTFAQVCDTQLGFGGYAHDMAAFKQAVSQINALKPDFVMICGDLVDSPNEASFADFNKIKTEFNMPCYCATGNHDVGKKTLLMSLQHFRKVVGADYYTFEHKGHTFVVVNTQLWKTPLPGESEKQDAWLAATLKTAANKTTRTFIVGHYPLFVKNPDEAEQYSNLPPTKRQELLGLFEEHQVVAVLGGHTHKLTINEHMGIQLVNAETTSRNFDKRPLGFRLWHIGNARPFQHDFIPLENHQNPAPSQSTTA